MNRCSYLLCNTLPFATSTVEFAAAATTTLLSLLQNTDIVTYSCNTFVIVLQEVFIGTQHYVLQINVVTHSGSFTKNVL
jgi:hypothetical protein